ncbi:UNVERIFIED_CONTAM: hypothetical protein FKN15_031251 [Acipenser sinensis]
MAVFADGVMARGGLCCWRGGEVIFADGGRWSLLLEGWREVIFAVGGVEGGGLCWWREVVFAVGGRWSLLVSLDVTLSR